MKDKAIKGFVYTVCIVYLVFIGFSIGNLGVRYEGNLTNYHHLGKYSFEGIRNRDIWMERNKGDEFFFKNMYAYKVAGYTLELICFNCRNPEVCLYSGDLHEDKLDILDEFDVIEGSKNEFYFNVTNFSKKGNILLLIVRVTPTINKETYVGVEYKMSEK